jgi:(p)ppGpp synthase/HD superfamily hydrolase
MDRKYNFSQLIKQIYPQEWKQYQDTITPVPEYQKKKVVNTILIDGDKLLTYTLCPECKARPGNKIIAKVGKEGIKIHTMDCKALKTVSFEKLLEAHWEGQEETNYNVSVELKIFNKYSNLLDVMTIFSDLHIVIIEASIKNNGDGTSSMYLDTEFKNPAKLSFLLNSLKKYDDSIKVFKKKIY